MNTEILKTVRERGLLLEKEIFDLLNSFDDVNAAKMFLESLERFSGQKIITKSALTKNVEYIQNFVNNLQGENKASLERTIVKLGISFEIRKEKEIAPNAENKPSFSVFCADVSKSQKIEVGDFVGNFRARYQQLQKILMCRPELQNLVSINKISSNRQSYSIIGMVSEKRITKNKNIILKFEDLTGEISALAKEGNEEVFAKANELQLDDIVAVKASGNRDLLFMHEIIFPDAHIPEKVKFENETCLAFLSDVHAGSKMHLAKSFEKFIAWINSEDEIARKIKYLFFVGDNIDGVGIFPGQEDVIQLKSTREQYEMLASYLRRIPKRIITFMCPGQHDASRIAEPQPAPNKKYAAALYGIDNLILVTNPCLVKILEGQKEFKVLMYHGASVHSFINEIPELREGKAHQTPAKAVKQMLKRRHLAPSHSFVVYVPNAERDSLVISEVPDLLVTGEVHRLDIENYNGILIITGSCWQSQTPYEEKVGNMPDPCKVPVLNLKTRELKIFDFGDEEETKKKGEKSNV